jgi:hypothetical protein
MDHEDDFFMVLNKEETIRPLIGVFPFRELLEYSLQKGSAGELQVQRQLVKVNGGFTSSMSMDGRAMNGVPQPALKKGSCDGVVVSSHLVVTHIIATLPLPWLGRTVHLDRDQLECARMISPDNAVEASTFTLSTECVWHRDKHNPSPTLDDLSWVMNINHVFDNGETLAALFYQQRSVCAYLRALAMCTIHYWITSKLPTSSFLPLDVYSRIIPSLIWTLNGIQSIGEVSYRGMQT